MEAELPEYGTYQTRIPEYNLMADALFAMGLQDGDRVLDVGAAFGDMGRYLQVERGWHGLYSPVDMIIDGTDLSTYEFPHGYNFIVLEQVIEHVDNWQEVLERAEAVAGAIVVATPNQQVVPEHEKHDFPHQMAHVVWLKPEDFTERGYSVSTYSLTGSPDDTIVASKVCHTVKEADGVYGDRTITSLSR
jgi:hypothetical protein